VTKTIAAVLSSAVLALAATTGAGAGRLGPIANLPPGWSHAQINVVIRRQPHTLTYDRGRVQSVGPASLTLRERDGIVVTVTVSASTQITINGRPATLAQIRRLEQATTVALDGGPATVVRVTIPPGLAAVIQRAAARGSGAGAGG
jgi:hypothetical protein